MTAVVQSSSPSSIQCGSPSPNDGLRQNHHHNTQFDPLEEEEEEERDKKRRREGEEEDEWSVLALFVTAFRKSLVRCYNKVEVEASISSSSSWAKKMEIGLPSNVRHVAHVTFDRFNGFLGLPVEFEPEVPRRAPSASTTVFGVSTNSMQLSFDSRGNSVPTILLMMQRRLYALGGLEVEGIFRITAGNAQEEYVRDQLNKGVIPDDADVHCLAGLIKAWFRELPIGLLDSFSPEQLMESQTEEDCARLARTLPLTEASLLDWAVNLMADVAQHEHLNKMNPRNVAVVFAPNMTHVLDPLTALMHAVQVMNFLKTLIVRTLREREDALLDTPLSRNDPSDENEPQSPLQTIFEGTGEGFDVNDELTDKPHTSLRPGFLNSLENILCSDGYKPSSVDSDGTAPCDAGSNVKDNGSSSRVAKNPSVCMEDLMKYGLQQGGKKGNVDNGSTNHPAGKNKATDIVSRMNPRSERVEAWR